MTDLKVWPNPFFAVDPDGTGLPCGTVRIEDRSCYVGAERGERHEVTYLGLTAQQVRDNPFELFKRDPVLVPATDHYLAHLRDGRLIAANQATAAAVGRQFNPTRELARLSGVARRQVMAARQKQRETDQKKAAEQQELKLQERAAKQAEKRARDELLQQQAMERQKKRSEEKQRFEREQERRRKADADAARRAAEERAAQQETINRVSSDATRALQLVEKLAKELAARP